MATEVPLFWFPRTKLSPPQVGHDVLPRPRLIEALHVAVLTYRLTLLSASAGSGKTTAVAALRQTYPDLPLAWVTLDADDNDPTTFLTLLIAALEQLLPDCVSNTRTLLTDLPDMGRDLRRVMGVLINDILACTPPDFVLVLDDLHLIENSAVLQALDYLLEHLPPMMHLAATCRHDPGLALARLRAQGHLAEFRMEELRFTAEEAAQWLNEVMGLGLTADHLGQLQQRTEGWVAGVRLLSLSLAQLETVDRAQFIQSFALSHRYIFDYLVEEVLQRQETVVRDFLLQTAILHELTPTLCRAITGRKDAVQMLEELHRRNLFLVMSDPAEPTYRYHALFAQFLRRQLHRDQADMIPELHRRAAQAIAHATQAIPHYLAAEMWEEAAELIEGIGRSQLGQGFIQATLRQWVEVLPDAVQQSHPWLLLILGTDAVQKGFMEQGKPYFDRALTIFRQTGDKQGEILCLLQSPDVAAAQGDPDFLEEIARQLAANPQLVTPYRHIKLLVVLAWTYQYRLQWDKVQPHLRTAIDLMLQVDDATVYHALAVDFGPQFLFCDDGIQPIERLAHRVLERFGEGDSLLHMGAYNRLGSIRFYQGQLEEAMAYARQARRIIRTVGGLAWQETSIDQVLLFSHLAQGNTQAIHDYVQERLPEIRGNESYAQLLPNYLYLQSLAFWYEEKYDEARHLVKPVAEWIGEWDVSQQRVLLLLQGWLAMADGRFPEAESHLQQAIIWQAKSRHTLLCSHARLNLAHLYWVWYQATIDEARLTQAGRELDSFLREVADGDMPGIALQSGRAVIPLLQDAAQNDLHPKLVNRILAIFGEEGVTQPISIPGSSEHLTPREVEVLQLLMGGATNRRIAEQLVISPRTVKAHVSHILQKLGVSSRTAAVARARELALL